MFKKKRGWGRSSREKEAGIVDKESICKERKESLQVNGNDSRITE